MHDSDTGLVTPVVRGAISALVCLATGLAIVVVPALGVQLTAEHSTMSALEAIILALNILVLGHGGGLTLTTGAINGAVTLTPLGLTGLLMLVSALGVRHASSRLAPVQDDGGLRSKALRDLGTALGVHTAVYATGLAALGALGRTPDLSVLLLSAAVSGVFVALLGGLIGAGWALRREVREVDASLRVLDLMPAPYGALVRGVGVALLGLLALGFLTVVVMAAVGLQDAARLQDSLDAGVVGGLVLTLVQLALLPLFAVWALVVLLGGTVTLGTGTVYGLAGISTGVMPALPWLATLPGPGTPPVVAWGLLLLPCVAIGVGAVAMNRGVVQCRRREQVITWLAYPVAVVIGVLLMAGVATGGIGTGRLRHLGPQIGPLMLPLLGIAVLTTGLAWIVLASPVPALLRRGVERVRDKVAAEEAVERQERSDGAAATAPDESPVAQRTSGAEPAPGDASDAEGADAQAAVGADEPDDAANEPDDAANEAAEAANENAGGASAARQHERD